MEGKIKVYELVIVGGGPAGVAAAVHAKATLPSVLLIEKETIGGKANEISLVSDDNSTQIRKEELGLLRKQLLESKLLVKQLEVISIQKEKNLFIVRGQKQCFYAYSVIIATGSGWKELELEKAEDIHYKNFSYKATSDAYLVRGRIVLVVGGGYSGCQAASFLSKFAKKVYLIHKGEELAVDYNLRSKILANGKIKTYLNSVPLETSGKEKLEACTISTNNNFQRKLKVSMIFPCTGTKPNSQLVGKIVDCTEAGKIIVNNSFQTNIEGLFAAGDVVSEGNSQVSRAITEGSSAAQAAIRYLLEKT